MQRKPKILAVEDSPELRVALELSLRQQGYEALVTWNGPAFLAAMDRFQPDLALIDLRLPGMSGSEILEGLREKSQIPAIVFSAVEDAADITAVINQGATDYVLKGTGIEELLRRIRKHIESISAWREPGAVTMKAVPILARPNPRQTMTSVLRILVCVPESAIRDQMLVSIRRGGHDARFATVESESSLTAGQPLIDIAILDPAQPERLGIRLVEAISHTHGDVPLGLIYLAERIQPESRRRLKLCAILDYLPRAAERWELELRLRFAFERFASPNRSAA